MEFQDVINKRYSVRKFDKRAVETAKIDAILETARLAPTAVNKQPERMLVLNTPEDMAKLAHCTKFTFDAPAAIIVCAAENEAWVRPYDGENAAIIDGSIVGAYIMLKICDLELGSCWVGHFDPKAVAEQFKLPAGMRPIALFPFGYPAEDSKPSSLHDKRMPLIDLVRFHSF